MPYFDKLTKPRLASFLEKIQGKAYARVADLEVVLWHSPEPLSFERRFEGKQRRLSEGEAWGDLFDCAWFRFEGTVPHQARGRSVVLFIDISGEALIVDANGNPVRGLTTFTAKYDKINGWPGKKVFPLFENARGGENILVWADGACNDYAGRLANAGTLMEAKIATCNGAIVALGYDFEVLLELMLHLPDTSARHHAIFAALAEVTCILHDFSHDEVMKAREVLSKELSKKGGDPSLTVSVVGHAHLDLAFLWPVRETIRKGARTFSTVLANMEVYPDYVFGASQAQLYLWMKERYPALYQRIKERVREGRWEVQGGMWVEADTNLPGGEALVRQFLHGKRFFRQEFGEDMKILWLPDVFGYSAALPQIMKKAGVDYFMTIKLMGNRFNKLPHNTFRWTGLDGSSVLAHMPPEGNYHSSAMPGSVVAAERDFLDKGRSDRCLMLFGVGDGGGGPGQQHLESLARESDLSGLCPVVQEPALAFFQRIDRDRSRYMEWRGELYYERHQGTFTSQARNKRWNRTMELLLRDAEILSSIATVETGLAWPRERFLAVWREVLLYQFHDILPGSSIGRVHDESRAGYENLHDEAGDMLTKAFAAIAADRGFSGPVVINTLSWERVAWLRQGTSWIKARVPAMSLLPLPEATEALSQKQRYGETATARPDLLENDCIAVRFNANGGIVSIVDKASGEELIDEEAGAANELAVYHDNGDAWDFPMDYRSQKAGTARELSAEASVDGPLLVRRSVSLWASSKIDREVRLFAGSRRIDFLTKVDWQERGVMMRVSFPTTVKTEEARCDIQFGFIRRPTHANTSWDMARIEVPAHRFVDVARGDLGFALMSDCKYGYHLEPGLLDLNLLRSPSYPDADADRAEHEFTYSILVHAGESDMLSVAHEAADLNAPLKVIEAPARPLPSRQDDGRMVGRAGTAESRRAPFLCVDASNIVIEAVKIAEDSEDIVVRLYESLGKASHCSLLPGFKVEDAYAANLLEERGGKLMLQSNGSIPLEFKPFEIQTLVLVPRR